MKNRLLCDNLWLQIEIQRTHVQSVTEQLAEFARELNLTTIILLMVLLASLFTSHSIVHKNLEDSERALFLLIFVLTLNFDHRIG